MKLKYIIIATAFLGLAACKGEDSKPIEKGNSQNKSESPKSHHNAVTLTTQQFEALQMEIAPLAFRTMSGYVEANGELEVPPQNEAAITAVVGANIVSIEVIEGDKVSKGQVVAYLSHPNIIKIQSDYLKAYSNRVFLKKDFERQKKLYDNGVGSGMNYQRAAAEYEASKALVNGLEAQLKLLNLNVSGIQKGTLYQRVALRSPINGFVQKVNIKTGQYVAPETELFEIVDTHHVHVDLMVFEKDVSLVKTGQTVKFSVQSNPGKILEATIYSIGKTFEAAPKAVHIHAEIENKEGHLIPGMYIQGRIEVHAIKKQAIPESALVKEGDKYFVFQAIKKEDLWQFKPVEVVKGMEAGGWIAISFMKTIPDDAKIALNNAYYLIAELKKGEAGHSH